MNQSAMPGVSAPALEIVPLGGLGEFGMNMMVVACGGTAILIDAGVTSLPILDWFRAT